MTQLLEQQLGRVTLACGVASQGGLWNHLLHGVLLLSGLLHSHMYEKLIFHCYY